MLSWRGVWLVVLGLGGCAGQAGGRSPPAAPTAALTQAPNESMTCRAALADEARQLALAISQESPDSVLVEGLLLFSQKPVVTNESLENIGILRELLGYLGHLDKSGELDRASAATSAACQTVDSPEQQAQDAVDQAIELLEAQRYQEMLERFTSPAELKALKDSGRFEAVLAKLKSGWGRVLLTKLQVSRAGPPLINGDGTISFFIPGMVGMLSQPVTLMEREGRWYFRAPHDQKEAPV